MVGKKLILLSLLIGLQAQAQAKTVVIKSWKTLKNDNGVEIKYPDCWEPKVGDPDEGDLGIVSAHDIAFEETVNCQRAKLDPPHQNSVGFSAGRDFIKSKEEMNKEIALLERNGITDVQRNDISFFKKIKLGENDALIYVRNNKSGTHTKISWVTYIYCPTTKVLFGGPAILDPDPSYFEKFKAGDMAMPEPEKSIFESIKCIPPKKAEVSKEK